MAEEKSALATVEIVYLDGKIVLPYETTSLKSRKTLNKKHKGNVGLLYKKTQVSDSVLSMDPNNINHYESIGTLLKIVEDSSEIMMTGGGINVSRRFVGIGLSRFELVRFANGESDEAVIRLLKDEISKEEEEELKKSNKIELIKEKALSLLQANDKEFSSSDLSKRNFIYNEENLIRLCYLFAMQLKMKYEDGIQFLKLNTVTARIDFLLKLVQEVKVKEMVFDQNFSFDVNNHSDLIRIERMVQTLNIPEVAKKAIKTEINKLKKSPNGSSETTLSQNYLEFILGLPWNTVTNDSLDLKSAREILDCDHSGLNKVKQRIIEFLAVKALNKKAKGSILCFHGPPGVGKTSLGKSIARALGRKYERVALGGVSDESMLRGHRRTYVGAYAGVIIQSIRRAGTKNPVILLDEIDKVGTKSYHGDPASALLEILDPNQNEKFQDHYLNIPFDLSDVFFICTANRIDTIHPALLDRMEVITLHGYTLKEKIDIAEKYILKKVQIDNGIPENTVNLDPNTLQKLIKDYTAEAGVRNLEKRLSSICRNLAVEYINSKGVVDSKEMQQVTIDDDALVRILGPPKYKENKVTPHVQPGTVFGLAWTELGGKVLLIETSYSRGSGKTVLTGQLGDVMKESVSTALSWIKSNYKKLNLESSPVLSELYEKKLEGAKEGILDKIDIHVHFPSAAIPKDGPSAGIAICTALVSLLTDRMVYSHIALTGEISLTGKTLPVGGIKEKVIAASMNGLKKVILPQDNKVDFDKMESKDDLNLEAVFVKSMWEVLDHALEPEILPGVVNQLAQLQKL
jgi:ATP-dependent Lon protease